MNNAYVMSESLEAKYRSQAGMITAAFAVFMLLLMFLLKWDMTAIVKIPESPAIEVELNLPEEEPAIRTRGGGGGGNPVQAAEPPGIAKAVPPQPGDIADSKNIEETNDKEATPIVKPTATKPKATKITNTSVVKAEPKPIVETPAPPKPKAVLGKTTTGTGKGGGSADNYDKAGGTGTGYGVGNGTGTGGGTGTGTGGGNGSGSGGGNGPKITRGDRKIVRYYSFDGDLEKAVIYANISVSPEGVGKFVSIAKGSSNSSNSYKAAIMQYLQNIRFDKADHESLLTVQFNFKVN